jgi:glycine oxidase
LKNNYDLIIIGGGIIGTSLAFWLADQSQGRLKVALLESGSTLAPPGSASFASAAMLSPAAVETTPPPVLSLLKRGLELYPELIARLEEEQPDQPAGYFQLDQLRLAFDEQEATNLKQRQKWYVEQGIVPEASWLNTEEVRQLEPVAAPTCGAIYHRAAVARASSLTLALANAAARRGAVVRTASPVAGLMVTQGRVSGVRLKSGEILGTDKVVVAAGAWSGVWLDEQLAGLGLYSAQEKRYGELVWPVRGQMFSVLPPSTSANTTGNPTASANKKLRHLLAGSGGYAYPRPDGRVVFGATVEPEAGFEVAVTPAGLAQLGHLVKQLAPSLSTASVEESWAGLRPGSKTELPLLGPAPELEGLWLSTGHFRSGVTFAPASAELLAQALLDPSAANLEALAPYRVSEDFSKMQDK